MKQKRIWLLIAGLALLPTTWSRAAEKLTQQQIYSLAHEANLLFSKANEQILTDTEQAQQLYGQAILRFQKIITDGGIRNPYLYYNIANAHLLQGDIGRAILNYRRGKEFGWDSAELAKNLAFARSKREDQIPLKTRQRVLQTLFFWHYDFRIHTRFWLGLGFWIFGWLMGVLVVIRQNKLLVGWLMAAGLSLALALGGSVASESIGQSRDVHGVIVVKLVTARQGDGENYPAAFKEPLHCGTEFRLRENRNQWYRMELSNGAEAWIPADAAELI